MKETIKMTKYSIMNMPMPININMWWNFGSMLGITLMIQIISGFILSMNYCPNISMAFTSIIHINNNISYGWLMRNIHVNGATTFFICMFIHILRGLYYMSYTNKIVWTIGTMILMMSMMTAFLGYILPWGQMSFWGATVITNLLSAIPYIGPNITEWIWGGFSINNATLNRFYSLHFILPFIISIMAGAHLMFLHMTGSKNPTGSKSKTFMIPFHNYFLIKDSVGFILIMMFITFFSTIMPMAFMDPDNFTMANPMVTPTHIKPEWYFLFAYSILRSIPSKLGGVIALITSILIIILPMMTKAPPIQSSSFYPLNQMMFWVLLMSGTLLSWTGGKLIEFPFTLISQINTIIYFLFFLSNNAAACWWSKMMEK